MDKTMIDISSKEMRSKQVRRLPPRLLIYGEAGVGKSSFAAAAPKPLFLDLEGGIDGLDVPRIGISAYDELMEYYSNIETYFNNKILKIKQKNEQLNYR